MNAQNVGMEDQLKTMEINIYLHGEFQAMQMQ